MTCILSDRLTVHTTAECDCDNLRTQVSQLQTQVRDLTNDLAAERERSVARGLTSDFGGGSNDELLQLPADGLPNTVANGHQLQSNFSSAWILQPTFTSGYGQRRIESDILGSAWHLWHNDMSTETPSQTISATEDVPIREYGEELVNSYFENQWAHLPILHKPTFLDRHYFPLSQGLSNSQFSLFQVYMVFAIVTCGKPRLTKGYTFSHREFFRKAVSSLPSVMTSNDLDCIQCLLLLCAYGRNEPQSVNMWHTTGLALRTAVGIDLHRQESIGTDSVFDAEMAKRLFWSAYVMDRSMAIAMGRPLGIEDSDITLPLPLQYTDEQLTSSHGHGSQPGSVPTTMDTSTFIHIIKLRRLNGKVYKSFHSMTRTASADELDALRLHYYTELNEWLVGAPRYLFTSSMFQSVEWFQIAYHYAILSLHRPSHAVPVPSFEALRLCADSSISLISAYSSLYAKNKISYSFIALNSIFMAAVTLLYSLRASSFVRSELTKAVMETNINTCLSLFRGMSGGREIAERCSAIVNRLGKATLALFDRPKPSNDQVDMEFLSWFGLKSQSTSVVPKTAPQANPEATDNLWQKGDVFLVDPMSTPSVDGAWRDVFAQGFDWDSSFGMDFFTTGTQ